MTAGCQHNSSGTRRYSPRSFAPHPAGSFSCMQRILRKISL